VHHCISRHLGQYASEMAWREDNRRKPNGTLYLNAAGAALGHPVSRVWAGYWQRAAQPGAGRYPVHASYSVDN